MDHDEAHCKGVEWTELTDIVSSGVL